eukprot:scaffold206670_cov22-Prasinocladus_malaysianus.AAC.1
MVAQAECEEATAMASAAQQALKDARDTWELQAAEHAGQVKHLKEEQERINARHAKQIEELESDLQALDASCKAIKVGPEHRQNS